METESISETSDFINLLTRLSAQWNFIEVPRLKRPDRGVNHSPSSSADVKERVELYFSFPSGPSLPVLAWTFW